ncbi:conserved hypothetical protein [Planktothrix serta PCC 8927]|uniref:Uncharacterized protein n=1 Tax=Planktothrix serta PCC 8927 TaxID=671068 RepID=A0A7Z9E436_9CYAN|nr:hypothetical protein [Planktothrix serta]VXD25713.1 conserved hypothetical protein [Planktothrix serta PCC 8927]
MDTSRLVAALDGLISQNRPREEKVFLGLLKQVWRVDWTVAPYDVWTHMIEGDVPYFARVMMFDQGDEGEEEMLKRDMMIMHLNPGTRYDWRPRMMGLINEVNCLRIDLTF